jgi:hypothetical protein
MQRRFPVPHVNGRRVHIGAGCGQRPHNRSGVGIIPGPIGEEMQGRPAAALRLFDDAKGEAGIGCEQPAQLLDLALLERRCSSTARGSSLCSVRGSFVITAI